jgi:hypothetical protein
LYPDKEHEARYTDIVRRYLDFDVEMVNIGSFWKTSENMITEYNQVPYSFAELSVPVLKRIK